MITLHTLKPNKGAVKKAKRIGRGGNSGGTAGKGHKGAQARSGYKSKMGRFEGGQTPLHRRIPKRGFKNPGKRDTVQVFTTDQLQAISAKEKSKKIDLSLLLGKKYKEKKSSVKIILGKRPVETALEVSAHHFSLGAKQAIERSGGKIVA